jgi:hypothetical protein
MRSSYGVAHSRNDSTCSPGLHGAGDPPESTFDMTADRVAALIGNGLSISYNLNLRMPILTKLILERVDQEAGSAAKNALLALANDPDAAVNFEKLFGPLDEMGELVRRMFDLADITAQPKEDRDHLEKAAEVFTGVRRVGVSHALAQIDTFAEAHHDQMDAVNTFLDALVAETETLTIANLNYDSLVLSSLIERHAPDLCDMKLGYNAETFEFAGPGKGYYTAHRLRDMDNLRPGGWADQRGRRIRLLHLHGSLTWLRHPTTGAVYAFHMEDIRASRYWEAWRGGDTDWEPVVVLTNQALKSTTVTERPFAGAYEVFLERLLEADRWLIAGYSFQDECVNAMLAEAWRRHKTWPPIMVVTMGDEPSEQTVLDAIGYDDEIPPEHFLFICREGTSTAAQSAEWQTWSDGGITWFGEDRSGGEYEPDDDEASALFDPGE